MGNGVTVVKKCKECRVKDICSKNYCALDAYEEVAARLKDPTNSPDVLALCDKAFDLAFSMPGNSELLGVLRSLKKACEDKSCPV